MKHSLDQVPVFTINIWKKCWKKQICCTPSATYNLSWPRKLQLECSFQK